MVSPLRPFVACAIALFIAMALIAVQAQAAPAKKKHPAGHVSKGQSQIAGGFGRFGTVYTLQTGFNFEILSGGYTLDPFLAYNPYYPKVGEKMLVLRIAVKNSKPSDNYFNDAYLFTLIDNHGQQYVQHGFELASAGQRTFNTTLRPGQGLGQPGLNDPLTVGFELPGDARIVKIMINSKAMGQTGDVLRYYIAGATKDEAGEPGDPKNILAGLPADCRDTSDKSGAIALASGVGQVGTYVPSGPFYIRLDKFEYSTTQTNSGNPPRSGQKFAIATVTVKTPLPKFDLNTGEGGDFTEDKVKTADGDTSKPANFIKATSDEGTPNRSLDPGDEATFRIVFSIDSGATVKTLTLGAGQFPTWDFDVSSVQ